MNFSLKVRGLQRVQDQDLPPVDHHRGEGGVGAALHSHAGLGKELNNVVIVQTIISQKRKTTKGSVTLIKKDN